MKKYVVNGLAVVGGVYLAKKASGYILNRYKKEIKASVIDKAAAFFAEEDEPEEKKVKKEDPLIAALSAYLNAKKGA